MTELQARLREAGRSMDSAAPDLDAATLAGRTRSTERTLAAAGVPIDGRARRRPMRPWMLLAGAAAAIALVVGVVLVLGRGTSSVDTGPAAPDGAMGPEGSSGTVVPVPAEPVPEVLTVTCEGDGTVLDRDVVRAGRDGVHLRIENPHPMAGMELTFGDPTWFDGLIGVPFGETDTTLPLRPGPARVSCHEHGAPPREAEVTIVDPDGRWVDPSLDCASPGTWSGSGAAPSRSTPDQAVRVWSPIETDTDLRAVRYAGSAPGEVVASTSDGDISFLLYERDGRWIAQPNRFCTSGAPSVRVAGDPAISWYERSDLDRMTSELRALSDRLDDPSLQRDGDLNNLCGTLVSVQDRVGGDVDLDDAATRERLDAIAGTIDDELIVGCFGPDPVLDREALAAQADAVLPLLVELREAIDERR